MDRILAAPMQIRGFGPVKAAAAAEVRQRVASLLDAERGVEDRPPPP